MSSRLFHIGLTCILSAAAIAIGGYFSKNDSASFFNLGNLFGHGVFVALVFPAYCVFFYWSSYPFFRVPALSVPTLQEQLAEDNSGVFSLKSKDIKTSNNLDINVSEGEFRYDPKETNEFVSHLKPYSGQKLKLDRWQTYIEKQKKEGYDAFEYTVNKTVWIFLVNAGTGHVRYVMWLQYSS